MSTYRIVRFFQGDNPREIIATGLSLSEAQKRCRHPESSSRTAIMPLSVALTEEFGAWFDGYEEE